MDVAVYVAEVGREIRVHRQRRGWTLQQLASEMSDPVPSAQTVETWEQASRNVPLFRIIQTCEAFGIQPHELFAAVDARVSRAVPLVNLWALARTDRPELAPARQWALTTLDAEPDASMVARLPEYALPPLAVLSRCSVADLVAALPYVTRHDH